MNRLVTTILVGLILIGVESQSARTQSYNPGAPPSGVIGYAKAINMNTLGDKPITMTATRWVARAIYTTGCTIPPTLLRFTVRTATGGGGATLGGVFDSLVSSDSFDDPTDLNNGIGLITTAHTAQTVYVNVSAAQGTALTCDVYIAADALP